MPPFKHSSCVASARVLRTGGVARPVTIFAAFFAFFFAPWKPWVYSPLSCLPPSSASRQLRPPMAKPPSCQWLRIMLFVHSASIFRKRRSMTFAGALRPRDGPTRRRSPISRRASQLAKLQELVRYWGSGYDWRKVEAKLNALPQFMTTIDGVDIHFIHVRSRHPNALPVIITHGWPGSVIEQLKIIGPLTDPTAHGGSAEDAFDVVIPSVPGYGFSGKPTGTGWDPDRIARAWAELMKRLGYTRYVAQGGDWGTPISSAMARQGAAGLLGIHINLPATVPPEVAAALARRARAGGTLRQGTRGVRRADDVRQEREPGLLHDDDRAAADGRLWRDGLTGRPRGVDPRASGLRAVDVRRRSRAVADERRRARQHHAVLADEHRGLGGAAVLGERRARQRHRCGRAEDRRDLAAGGHHGISGGRLSRRRRHGPGARIAT